MAIFDPEVGDTIQFGKKAYIFVENPNAPGMVHSSEGGFGYIFKMKDDTNEYALKQFKPDYRQPDNVVRAQQLSKFKDDDNLRVVDRLVVTPDSDLAQKHQDLRYSIIMPWIQGKVWSNYLSEKIELSPTQSICLAQTLVLVLAELERRQAAHCDLSSGNLVIEDDGFRNVQLIDIEDMYSPEFEPPRYRLLGSPGYAPDWIQNQKQGTYCQEGDRFAGAVLLAEILCWHFPEIRQASYNEGSYFDPREVGKDCDRYKLLIDRLGSLELDLSILFKQMWFSSSLQSCPTLLEWEEIINEIKITSISAVSPAIVDSERFDTSWPIPLPPELVDTTNRSVFSNDSQNAISLVGEKSDHKTGKIVIGGTLGLLILIVMIIASIGSSNKTSPDSQGQTSHNSFTATPKKSYTPTPFATRDIYYPFADCAGSRLRVGDRALISSGGGFNAIRDTADTHPSDNIIGKAYPGDYLQITDGPVCNWGWILWEVKLEKNGLTGWTPETDGEEFWIQSVPFR